MSTQTTAHTITMESPCPCGSEQPMGMCCGQYFDGSVPPPTPEALIKARYAAHASQHYQFLIDSIHPDHREGEDIEEIRQWAEHVQWKGLQILTSIGGGSADTTASIGFVVFFSVNGYPRQMKETAHFKKENGRWFYTDGDVEGQMTVQRTSPKIGRNEPCPCGSGKKYKKCCLNKDMPATN